MHWNVVGPHFIAVHEMLDPQVVAVRDMVDAIAERIATLGLAPVGTPGALVAARDWEDYALGRALTTDHLKALDEVYVGVITSHRVAAEAVAELDAVLSVIDGEPLRLDARRVASPPEHELRHDVAV